MRSCETVSLSNPHGKSTSSGSAKETCPVAFAAICHTCKAILPRSPQLPGFPLQLWSSSGKFLEASRGFLRQFEVKWRGTYPNEIRRRGPRKAPVGHAKVPKPPCTQASLVSSSLKTFKNHAGSILCRSRKRTLVVPSSPHPPQLLSSPPFHSRHCFSSWGLGGCKSRRSAPNPKGPAPLGSRLPRQQKAWGRG